MPEARADIGTSECPVMPGEVFISSRKGLRSLARIMMSARAAGISYEDLCLRLLASATLDTPAGAVGGIAG